MRYVNSVAVWDTAFALGVFLQVTKVTEIILRPHQQEAIQKALEALTLRLEYTRPLVWFEQLREQQTIRSWLVQITILGLFLQGWVACNIVGLPSELLPFYLMTIGAPAVIFILQRGPTTFGWLCGDGRCRTFLVRFSCFFIFGILAKIAIVGVTRFNEIYILGRLNRETAWSQMFVLSELAVTAPLESISIILWVYIVVGGFALSAMAFLGMLSIIVYIGRGLAWRVVEYNKGSVAAISLILTVIIGCVDLLLRTPSRG